MTSETYDRKRISKEFASWRVGVTPSAAEKIADAANPGELIEQIGQDISDDVQTIEVKHVQTVLQENQTKEAETGDESREDAESEVKENVKAQSHDTSLNSESQELEDDSQAKTDTDSATSEPEVPETTEDTPERNPTSGTRYIEGEDAVYGDTPEERWPDAWNRTLLSSPLNDGTSRDSDHRDVTIKGDITGDSRTTGEYGNFQRLFRDRHKRLRSILEDRMPSTTTINSIDKRMARRDRPVGVIGLVNEVRKTKNGHDLIEIEDSTGVFPVLFSKDHTPEPIQDQIEKIIPDEVIGFVGSLADDGEILFGDEIHFPDLSPMRVPNTADRSVKAVLLSDIHIGAVDFAADEWTRFVEWMRSDPEAEDIEYILIAGDLVEGIGVYPGQEDELDVVDIYDQYQLCAEALEQLPDDVDIYTIMGNHDTVRLAEPQPVIKDAFKEPFPDNVHFSGNPSMFDIEGVKFLLYHGMSLNPFTDRTPGLDIHDPTDAMQMMLEKRHLAPMYGMNVRLAPENKDYLVIDDVPDVLHTGHVHTFGIDSYKNVLMMNTGCWQYQTDFQRRMNVEPDVGLAPVLDLETLDVEVKKF